MLWQRSRPLVSGAVTLAALAGFVLVLVALFSNANQLTGVGLTPTPQGPLLEMDGTYAESMGMIGTRRIPMSVRAPLPALPGRVPLYHIEAMVDNPSPDLARAWAEKLSLGPVRVYAEGDTGYVIYVAQAEDGRVVGVAPGGQVTYQVNISAIFVPLQQGAALDPEIARTAATTFLENIPDLVVVEGNSSIQVTFRVEPSVYQAAAAQSSVLTFQYTPLIDGIPASTHGGSGEGSITVGADGQVQIATFTPLRIKPTGEEVAPRPAEDAVQAFLNGDQTVLRGSGLSSRAPEPLTQPPFYYRQPSYTAGESVTARGYLQHWSAVDGGPDLYFLSVAGPQTFLLEGKDLNTSQPTLEVNGHIGDQVYPGVWRIEVGTLQPLSPESKSFGDWTGIVRRQSDGAWLETDAGQKILLPDPPADVPDGERIYVPGVMIGSDAAAPRLEWGVMMVAPAPENGGARSGAVVAVERSAVAAPTIVPPTPIATPFPAAVVPPAPVYPSGIVQSVSSVSGGAFITPTLPAWWTYQPGEEVTLAGELSAQAFRIQSGPSQPDPAATPTSERVVLSAQLLAGRDVNETDETVPIMLVGDQVTLDLVRLDGLHVRVQGRLLSPDDAAQRYPDSTDAGFPGLALEVAGYDKAVPGETKGVYSGRIRVDTLDGREVVIFSDTLSGKEFVLADSLTITYTLEMYRQQANDEGTLNAIGIVVPSQTFAGRPLLRLTETMSGTHDPELDIQTLRDKLENPVLDIGQPDGPQDMIIDRIELVYVFQTLPPQAPEEFPASPTELFYRLSGHSSDGRYTATYDLSAIP